MDHMKELNELCDVISREIGLANDKIRTAGGKVTPADMEYIDRLTHSLKSIKAVMGMMEEENGEGEYSGRAYGMPGGVYRGSYRGGGFYARGGRRRDGMGRYSRNGGYPMDDGMLEELRNLMDDAPNESVRRDIQRLVDKIEQQM